MDSCLFKRTSVNATDAVWMWSGHASSILRDDSVCNNCTLPLHIYVEIVTEYSYMWIKHSKNQTLCSLLRFLSDYISVDYTGKKDFCDKLSLIWHHLRARAPSVHHIHYTLIISRKTRFPSWYRALYIYYNSSLYWSN